MGAWTLVLYIYAGAFARGDSVTITNIDGFSSQQVCEVAGKQSEALVKNSAKDFRFVCVKKG